MDETDAVTIEFSGKTRHMVEAHALRGEGFGGSNAAAEALDKDPNKVVISTEEQMDELLRILEAITSKRDYNGHMEEYREKIRSKIASKRHKI